jgi:hypothetical protein
VIAEKTLSWFADVDWGSEDHQACLVDAQGNIVGEREFTRSGAALAVSDDWMPSITDRGPTACDGQI